MSSNKTNKYYLLVESDYANQTVIIAADIENYTSSRDNTGSAEPFFDFCTILPTCYLSSLIPGQKRLLGSGMPFPEFSQCSFCYHSHFYILPCTHHGCNRICYTRHLKLFLGDNLPGCRRTSRRDAPQITRRCNGGKKILTPFNKGGIL